MLVGTLSSIALVAITIVIHSEFLRRSLHLAEHSRLRPRYKVVALIAGAFIAHTIEIYVYALGYILLDRVDVLTGFAGTFEGRFDDYLYFSAASYTTLGYGDIVPIGATRLLAGTEALNGLVLITWTASVTYLMMDRYWRRD